MERYLIFAGPYYYPRGGSSDFVGVFLTEEEALNHTIPTVYMQGGGEYPLDWAEVVRLTDSGMEQLYGSEVQRGWDHEKRDYLTPYWGVWQKTLPN